MGQVSTRSACQAVAAAVDTPVATGPVKCAKRNEASGARWRRPWTRRLAGCEEIGSSLRRWWIYQRDVGDMPCSVKASDVYKCFGYGFGPIFHDR